MPGKTKRVPFGDQLSLFPVMEVPRMEEPGRDDLPPSFVLPQPERLYFGGMRIWEYLESNSKDWVVNLGRYLSGLDWSAFEASYHPRGRLPLHPRILVGLLVYGLSKGISSLRGLEDLATMEMGAMFLCGGYRPDHSTIGKFVLRHAEVLEGELYAQILADMIHHLKLRLDVLSGDGTVVQAWGSHYRALKEEALREAARRAAEGGRAEEAERLVEATEELERRVEKKRGAGKPTDGIRVHPGEPEAVFQPLKSKVSRLSYKPLVLANKDRFIVGFGVEPTHEARGMLKLLEAHSGLTGHDLKRVMMDSGFLTKEILCLGMAKEVDLLIPSGCAERGEWERQAGSGKNFVKNAFHYDEDTDTYRCPAGQSLWPEKAFTDKQGNRVRRYRCRNAGNCPRRKECTKSSRGRTVKRYDIDEVKEAMAQVMAQPRAKACYRKRQGMVEPVFGHLLHRQGLNRFHRRGLTKVRLEFSLHVIAYNLRRAFQVMGMIKGKITDPDTGEKGLFLIFFYFGHVASPSRG